ncbi:hypothetical protein [Parabacteroides faecis]|uniref:Lanthionine synthetase C-like protein n=1 Tax=Parabacteroides faecis TaxID=1217282 RepID=A0ABR6KTM9_9BACT|nr:hypothetical protein [Parabacteroides faecis]MBB4624855.1 hypothetical protein [Parabacteroides faecis]GGK14702.1 hypothetical protein GCM10007084_42580 [Parabacteroides faecis]
MQQYQSMTMEEQLSQVANMLLLNGTLTESPGLVHGKMGVAIFFFHYAQYTENMLFADYAVDLIGEMQNQIHLNSPADYEKGIAGIGVGIDYLIRNDFLLVEDDICEDFDQRMVRAVMYDPWQDFSMYDGLTGYGRYWISRLRYQEPAVQAQECLGYIVRLLEENLADIPSEEQTDVYCFLYDLQRISGYESCNGLLEQCRKWEAKNSFSRLEDSTISNFIRKVQSSRYLNDTNQNEIDTILNQIEDLDTEKPPVSMGLLTGYAGEGLLRLEALRKTDHSWTFLL